MLNRLALSRSEPDRHARIAAGTAVIEALFVDLFLDAHAKAPAQIIRFPGKLDAHLIVESRLFQWSTWYSKRQSFRGIVSHLISMPPMIRCTGSREQERGRRPRSPAFHGSYDSCCYLPALHLLQPAPQVPIALAQWEPVLLRALRRIGLAGVPHILDSLRTERQRPDSPNHHVPIKSTAQ